MTGRDALHTSSGDAITSTDLVAGVPAVFVAVVAVVSLALAHSHHHSLTAVCVIIGGLLIGVAAFVVRRLRTGRLKVTSDRRGTAAVLLCGAVAAALFTPGFSLGVADKDAGGYVSHAVEIARSGSYSFTDPALATHNLPVAIDSPGARLPGIWIRNQATGLIVPQFYHLWPALLATSYDVAGFGGLTLTGPLVLAIAVMMLVAILRRLIGYWGALIGGLLLATNMLEVWQAKFPTTEGFAQLIFLTALFGVVLALQTRLILPAAVGGAMVGVAFLNRADGWLLVMGAIGVVAALVALRVADRRTMAFTIGLAAVLPYASWAAYAASVTYTRQNSIPSLTKSIAVVVVIGVVAMGVRVGGRRLTGALRYHATTPTSQRRIGAGVTAVALILLVLGFLRKELFGIAYGNFNGTRARSFDEAILPRLAWFVTPVGFIVMAAGISVATMRRWRAEMWAVLLPILIFFPVFAYESRNSTRLMWWTRRYVPVVLPGIVIFIAIAVALALSARGKGRWLLRVPAIAIVMGLLGVFLHQSIPVRRHCEWCGSFGLVQGITKLASEKPAVFLWQPLAQGNPPMQIFAIAAWLQRGKLSVMLPPDPSQDAAYITNYRNAFPNRSIFVVTSGASPPAVTATALLRPVGHFSGAFFNWVQSDTTRPDHAARSPYDLAVYQVAGS